MLGIKDKQRNRALVIPVFDWPIDQSEAVSILRQCETTGVFDELVFVFEPGKIQPWFQDAPSQAVQVTLISSPMQYGKEGACKRGLSAANAKEVMLWEHPGVSLQEIIAYARLPLPDRTIMAGIGKKGKGSACLLWFKSMILGKGLIDGPFVFRYVQRKYLNPILGRVILNTDGVNTEWAYLVFKLGYQVKTLDVDVACAQPTHVWFRIWNILRIRNWHFPMINTQDEHMSDKELQEMFTNESTHWWFKAKDSFMRKIMRHWVDAKNKSILDAGCGTGHNMRYLAQGGKYVGCDVSMHALQFCLKNGHGNLVQGHLEHLPFQEQVFDLVLSLDVIEHTSNPYQVIRQLKRVLRTGGQVIITVPACRFLFGPHDEALSHFRRYDPRDLRELLEEAGFEVQHLQYLFFFTFFPAALIRLLRKLFVMDPRPRTDMYYMASPLVNAILEKLFLVETYLLCKVPLPFGTSIVAVAKKL